jgi:GR25 family glycosyltransferase involved in LPS biosynthesis
MLIESIPAFCITLERRQDRWRRFQDQSGIQGLDLKRFLGVDGKTLDLKSDPRVTTLTKRNISIKKRRSHEELDTIGGVGCALSHIAVWQWLVDNDQEMVLVFEDDAVVPPDFIERANECIKNSQILKDPKKWDMWLLGGKWEDLTQIPGEKDVVRIDAFVLFHAYVITKRCAKKFLNDVYPIHCHIDIWASIYAYLNDLRLVGCPKLILEQTQRVKTDIQPDNTCHICNVPTDYELQYKIVSKMEWNRARAAELLCVGFIGYILYQQYKKYSS